MAKHLEREKLTIGRALRSLGWLPVFFIVLADLGLKALGAA